MAVSGGLSSFVQLSTEMKDHLAKVASSRCVYEKQRGVTVG